MKASATTKGHDHADDSPRPGQYDVGDEPDGGPKTPKNPGAAAPNVRVTVPVSVEVRLVNANLLQEYEIWTWLGTANLSAVVGFWVALPEQVTGLYIAGIGGFATVLAVCVGMATWRKWTMMRTTTKTVVYGEGVIEGPADELSADGR